MFLKNNPRREMTPRGRKKLKKLVISPKLQHLVFFYFLRINKTIWLKRIQTVE
jgi:hypothetical protein